MEENQIEGLTLPVTFNDLFVECSKYENNILQDIEIDKFKNMSVTYGNCIRLFRHFVYNREDVVRPLRPSTTEINFFTDKEDRKEVKGLRNFYDELQLSDPFMYKSLKVCSVPCNNLILNKYTIRKLKKQHNLRNISQRTIKKQTKRIKKQIIPKIISPPVLSQCYVLLTPIDKIEKFEPCFLPVKHQNVFSNINSDELMASSPSVTSESECSFTKSSIADSSTLSSEVFMRLPVVI